MKVVYNNLKCPNCGATNIILVNDDIFLCEYCDTKFNFDLDKIEINEENKIFIEELKQRFYSRLYPIYEKIKENKIKLNYYNKLAYPKKFKIFSYLCLILSIIFLQLFPIVTLIGCAFSICLIFLAYKHAKNRYNKYRATISYFASKIVEYEEQASIYTRLISKLTQ